MAKSLDKLVEKLRNKPSKSIEILDNLQEIIYPAYFCYGETTSKKPKKTKFTPKELADGMANIISAHNPIYQSGDVYNK